MKLTVLILLSATLLSAPAAELETKLGKKGAVLLEEKFDGKELPKGLTRNTGKLTVAEGALHVSEVAEDKHAARCSCRTDTRCGHEFPA